MSIDIKQFHDLILVPTLKSTGLYSKEACQIIIGTGCQESQFKFLREEDSGKSLGFFQCQPMDYKRIVNDAFVYDKNLKDRILSTLATEYIPVFSSLMWNLKFACIICRLHYVKLKIPFDLPSQAEMYKRYYNSPLGSATVDEYIENFNKYASNIW
jgi:hypothetical protein